MKKKNEMGMFTSIVFIPNIIGNKAMDNKQSNSSIPQKSILGSWNQWWG